MFDYINDIHFESWEPFGITISKWLISSFNCSKIMFWNVTLNSWSVKNVGYSFLNRRMMSRFFGSFRILGSIIGFPLSSTPICVAIANYKTLSILSWNYYVLEFASRFVLGYFEIICTSSFLQVTSWHSLMNEFLMKRWSSKMSCHISNVFCCW